MKSFIVRTLVLIALAVMCLSHTTATAQIPNLLRMNSAGTGPFQRIAFWLGQNIFQNHQELSIWIQYSEAGRGFRDGILLLHDKNAEITVVNSRTVAAMALRGRGLFKQPFRELRGIRVFPQYDWCLFAVDASLGVRSFEELKAKKVPLKLATGYLNDGIAFLGFEILRRHGISREDLQRWGSEFIEGPPSRSVAAMAADKANAIFQEGAYNDRWKDLARKRPLNFLPLDPKVAREMQEELGAGFLTVPAEYYPGQKQPVLALSFSDFLLCVREDMPELLAYELARIATERRQEMPGNENFPSPDPDAFRNTSPVPLHRGAERYYKEKGVH